MPIVQIHLLEGRTLEQKRKVVADVTNCICQDLEVRPEQVRIILEEMPREHYAIGGVLVSDR